MKGLFDWALDEEYVSINPTATVKPPKKQTGDGFKPWSEDDIAHFEETYPLGTRERVAFDVLLYTGLRRGDVVRFGREHILNGFATVKTEKTGGVAYIPIEPELKRSLEAGPCGDKTFIVGMMGQPRRKEAFGNWFHNIAKKIGIDKSAHGLRKAGANRDALRGWTEAELEAKYSWHGGQMAARYTRSVNRRKLAANASQRNQPKEASPASTPVRQNRCASLVILDDQNRMLMNRAIVPSGTSVFQFWAPPRADVGSSETDLETANRILTDELNLGLDLKGPIHINESRFDRGEVLVENIDVFFMVRLSGPQIGVEKEEASAGATSAWWSLADLQNTKEPVFPMGLADVLRQAAL